jgi:hypothetical protein
MPTLKASKQEPARRVVTITLSISEALALVHWHTREAKATSKRFGQAALELQASSPLACGRQLKQLSDAAQANIKAHGERAQEILNKTKGGVE